MSGCLCARCIFHLYAIEEWGSIFLKPIDIDDGNAMMDSSREDAWQKWQGGIAMEWSTKSKWIWMQQEQQKDSHGEFVSEFTYTGGDVSVKISVDTTYTLFVNGVYVASEQYPDFPHYKVYDEIDITKYCNAGQNRVAILAWYFGETFMTYYTCKAALRFEVCCDGMLLSYSHEKTPSRISSTYQNGLCHILTPQLGFGYAYDTTKEDAWMVKDVPGFSSSYIVAQDVPLFKRSIPKTRIGERVPTKLIQQKENYYLFDFNYRYVRKPYCRLYIRTFHIRKQC